METIQIQTEYIRADAFLKFVGLAESGGHAKRLIGDGGLRVNGELCTQRGKKLRPGDELEAGGRRFLLA